MSARQQSAWRAAGLLAAATLVAGATGVAWLRATPAAAPAPAPTAARLASADFAPSLRGTTPDGPAALADGAPLVLDPTLIRLFDYYLSTLGERSLTDIRAQAEQELDRRMNPTAARQAKDVLLRYLDFKKALLAQAPADATSGRNGSADLLRERLAAMHALRARYFSTSEARALFGPDDADAADALARMAIQQDPALDTAGKRARIAALDAALPDDVRAARAAPLLPTRLQEQAAQLRAQGAGDDEVYRMRAAAVSPEAANRLADLDREEADWQSRIATYRTERGGILSSGSADAQRQEAIGALRNRLFTPEEQRRLAAYEG